MEWSEDIENILESIRQNAVLFNKNHKTKYFFYKSLEKYFRIPTIILSAVASVSSVGLHPYLGPALPNPYRRPWRFLPAHSWTIHKVGLFPRKVGHQHGPKARLGPWTLAACKHMDPNVTVRTPFVPGIHPKHRWIFSVLVADHIAIVWETTLLLV